jgi:flagellar biosynthesis chaperone FliJ
LITARYAWAQTKIAKKATEEAETALYKALQEKRKRYDIQLKVNLRKLKAYKKAKEAPLIDSAQVKIQNIGQRIADLDRTIFQLKKKIKK